MGSGPPGELAELKKYPRLQTAFDNNKGSWGTLFNKSSDKLGGAKGRSRSNLSVGDSPGKGRNRNKLVSNSNEELAASGVIGEREWQSRWSVKENFIPEYSALNDKYVSIYKGKKKEAAMQAHHTAHVQNLARKQKASLAMRMRAEAIAASLPENHGQAKLPDKKDVILTDSITDPAELEAFARAGSKLESLWEELRIPRRERKFFSRHYFYPPTYEKYDVICAQITRLLEHRSLTVEVLKCIELREMYLVRLRELCEKNPKEPEQEDGGGAGDNGGDTEGQAEGPASGAEDEDAPEGGEKDGESAPPEGPGADEEADKSRGTAAEGGDAPADTAAGAPAEETGKVVVDKETQTALEQLLATVRALSVEAVEAIVNWRCGLWRPQAFLWSNTNYLMKMQGDIALILGKSILEEVVAIPLKDNPMMIPSAARDAVGIEADDAPAKPLGSIADNYMISGVEFQRLTAAEQVVMREKLVQARILQEQKELLHNGFYMPTLRWVSVQDNVNAPSFNEVFSLHEQQNNEEFEIRRQASLQNLANETIAAAPQSVNQSGAGSVGQSSNVEAKAEAQGQQTPEAEATPPQDAPAAPAGNDEAPIDEPVED